MQRTLLIILTILLLISPLKSRGNEQYAFQQISTQNGLSSSVRCLIVSHEKGYVWIGTKSGIGRFDGYELKVYRCGNITHIAEDKEHNIWAITPKGLFCYNYLKDEFLQVSDKDNNPVIASSICLWSDGVLFGGNGMLYKYSYTDHQTSFLCSVFSRKKYNITNLLKWDRHTLIATDRWSSALLIDPQTGHTRPVPFESNEVIATFIDKNGNIWLAPYHQGVKCYNKKGQLLHSYNTQNSIMRTNVVLSITESKGRIWIGTDGAGIYIVNPQNDKMDELMHIPGDSYSLPTNSILCLYADSNNNIWAGSVRSGLINIKKTGMRIYSDAIPGMEYGLSEKSALSIYQDEKESIWIGTDGGGINRFNPITKKFHHVLSTWGDKVSSITGINKQYLLVTLFSKGLFFFDKQKEQYKPLIIVNDKINTLLCQRGKTVNVFQNTPKTVLLLSEQPYCYDLNLKKFTPITIDKRVHNIAGTMLPICSKGTLTYLHDFKHIYLFDSRTNYMKAIYECKGDTTFNSVSADEQGLLWIGSNHGLGRYSVKNRKYTNIPNSLINEINSLICDKQGRVWIGTEGKLLVHIIRTGKFILYGEADGIIQNEYLEKPRLLSLQGDIYMGGVNGLLCIDKKLPYEASIQPSLKLAEIFVGGERVNEYITNNDFKIKEQSNSVSIKIIAQDKDIFRKSMYRYSIRGAKEQTIYSYQPELMLNGLSSGTYQMWAACSTRTGGWTKDYLILNLKVLPPWYKSNWFIVFCILIIISVIFLTFYSLLRRKENKLKWAMKEHEQQIYEEKVRLLININHELRTPLTLIHAPLKQLLNMMSHKDEKYSLIQSISKQSERMKDLLNMVLNVRKMEVGQSTLNIEVVNIHSWIEQLIEDFRPELNMNNISIVYQADKDIENLPFDKEKCTTILTNLLINALKYSSEKNQICVSTCLSEDGTRVRISVSDQGPGLKGVDINSLFIRFYQGENSRPGTGIGLSYSKILAEQHRGSIGAYDHGDKPGATFWFELPRDMQTGKITLQPQAYLNELLAPIKDIEGSPETMQEIEDTRKYTLLIVDDNKDLTNYLTTAIKDKFKKIEVAYNGEEALKICRESHPDVIVSDIQMPLMNGYEFCKCVKEDIEISHIPIILLTARNDEESQIFGYKNGADAYLTKPFEINILYTIIQSQLKNRERMRTRYTEKLPLPQPQESTFSSVDEDFLRKLNKLLFENINNQQLGIPFICTEMGMSRASLYNKMKVLTGMGINDYITKVRLEQAIYLLTQSSLSINEIADQTGFSTPRYFSTVFKQYMGCTPTQYKESL